MLTAQAPLRTNLRSTYKALIHNHAQTILDDEAFDLNDEFLEPTKNQQTQVMGQRIRFADNPGEMAKRVKVDVLDFDGSFDPNMFVD